MVDCPECGDALVGFTFKEALDHLRKCPFGPDGEWTRMVLGFKAGQPDELYRRWTGDTTPNMPEHERIKWYYEFAKDLEESQAT